MALGPYTADADDTSTPGNLVVGGYAAAEVRAIKAKILAQQSGAVPEITTGTAVAYVVASYPIAPATNTLYTVIPHLDNITGATLTTGAGSPIPIVQLDGTTPILAGMMRVGVAAQLQKLANSFMLLNPQVDSKSLQSALGWDKTAVSILEISPSYAVGKFIGANSTFTAINCYYDGSDWRHSNTSSASLQGYDDTLQESSYRQTTGNTGINTICTFVEVAYFRPTVNTLRDTTLSGKLTSRIENDLQGITGDIVVAEASPGGVPNTWFGTFPTLVDGATYRIELNAATVPYGDASVGGTWVAPNINGKPVEVKALLSSTPVPLRHKQIIFGDTYILKYIATGDKFLLLNPRGNGVVFDAFNLTSNVPDTGFTRLHGGVITNPNVGEYNINYGSSINLDIYTIGYVQLIAPNVTYFMNLRRTASNSVSIYIWNTSGTPVNLVSQDVEFVLFTGHTA